uniref:E2 ubiquitin-conjugating enzyme n=1 Tax=Myotis myotis TaxID=51298 RepID=A0A7J7V3N8_MYOMY|nr:hypothetical protein mMyoMyo1_008462 [Myotis myotis]
MAASRRLVKELEEIRKRGMKNFRNIQVDDANVLTWQGLIVPDNPPYDKGAFRIEINFPAEYPFKPPKVTFKTKIYHPNVDDKGQVCLPVISAENWKPATKTHQVIQALIALVNDPQPPRRPGRGVRQGPGTVLDERGGVHQEIRGEASCGLKPAAMESSEWERPRALPTPRKAGLRGRRTAPPTGVCLWQLLTFYGFLNQK